MEEGCSKKSAGAVPALPDDPLVEILSRVPAKSVCRFKCVSKAWRDLIADPDNRKKLRQAMQGLFVETSMVNGFSFIDLTTVRSVPLDMDPCFSFLTEMTGIKVSLCDSCNGLILLYGVEPSQQLDNYIVCNPTTRQWSVIPVCISEEEEPTICNTYLVFDPAMSSHFHLVQFKMPAMYMHVVSLHVYSSETGTWSQDRFDEQGQLEGWHHQFTLDPIGHTYAFVNGFLHLLIIGGSNVKHILAVDVQGKARRMITVPGVADGRHTFVCYLGQSQGRLHCMIVESAYENDEKLSTWVLQDYDTQEWVLKNTVNSLDVFGVTGEVSVIDIHQDCNLVFFFHQLNYELIAYDMDSKEVSVIGTLEDDKEQSDFARYIPYFSELPALTNK